MIYPSEAFEQVCDMTSRKHITELKKTAEFLRQNIEKARHDLEGEPLSVPYDHGGGQSGMRENPAYTAFEKLLKSYQSVLTQLNTLADEKNDTDISGLHLVGNSKWKKQA